ncbi:lysozyme inhibitor LprI family protein [Massilia rhizosphaerae]|uniref:lysozyme inhibitor LprI family protein n=1 Tax=Massilia rhizosphaerae TaxID=2784389 RepID=UPI0018DBF851|nr:lysozyme inhibitor LprI family protein [Massilia rhizosphaerae]
MPTSFFKLAVAGLAACAAASVPAAPEYPTTHTFGVPFSKDEAWYRQCMRVEHAVAPAAPAPAPGATCDASRLYYEKRSQAVTSPAEWQTVRACALARGDNAVLMMLYANGFGVPRDLDIAIHYACSLDFAAKAEMEARIAHLAGGLPAGAVFDQCDDITSGMMGSVCAGIRQSQAGRVRAARLDRVARAIPASARPAFKTLRAAADAYAGAATAEVDMQGTAAPALAIEHEGKLDEQFMRAVLDVLDGKVAATTPTEAKRLDGELNAVYQDLMNAPAKQKDESARIGASTVERGDVRKAERLWLAYRDAFLAFRGTLPSGPNPDAIEALLLRQRIAALKTIARYR